METKKVRLKSLDEIEKLEKEGKIRLMNISDSGEWRTYGVGPGAERGPTYDRGVVYCKTFWYEEYGDEALVVDHPNPISKGDYNDFRILYEEE
jgi:hypothetical protein